MRSKLVTSEMRGAFLNAEAARAEFFNAINLAKED
jgi:GTP cyclohydrolase I